MLVVRCVNIVPICDECKNEGRIDGQTKIEAEW